MRCVGVGADDERPLRAQRAKQAMDVLVEREVAGPRVEERSLRRLRAEAVAQALNSPSAAIDPSATPGGDDERRQRLVARRGDQHGRRQRLALS